MTNTGTTSQKITNEQLFWMTYEQIVREGMMKNSEMYHDTLFNMMSKAKAVVARGKACNSQRTLNQTCDALGIKRGIKSIREFIGVTNAKQR